MIKYLFVAGLNGRQPQEFHFQPDINIITGPNGSGKTTLLKLLWYLVSGNIERIPREMHFDEIHLGTIDFDIRIAKLKRVKRDDEYAYDFRWTIAGDESRCSVTLSDIVLEMPPIKEANLTLAQLRGSIFFSTFRRLEGGFSMTPQQDISGLGRHVSRRSGKPSNWASTVRERMELEHIFHGPGLQPTLSELASKLSLYNHRFIASISTTDIVQLLTTKYAEISEFTNRNHSELSKRIFSLIRSYTEAQAMTPSDQLAFAKSSLDDIAREVERVDYENERLLRPFSVLSDLISRIMRGRGVRVTENIILGEKEGGIDSSLLSAGEKQMLSFLCYNAFHRDVPIFIDEPEISLHIDWQRILFSTLLSQGTGNQFIAATHSPFIYAKYEDKEMELKMA